jgi:ADP-glucose pyrophosphorylase
MKGCLVYVEWRCCYVHQRSTARFIRSAVSCAQIQTLTSQSQCNASLLGTPCMVNASVRQSVLYAKQHTCAEAIPASSIITQQSGVSTVDAV